MVENKTLKVNGADNSAEKNNNVMGDLKMVENKNFSGVNVLSDKGLEEVLGTCAVCGKVKTKDNKDNFRTVHLGYTQETICNDCLYEIKDDYNYCESCEACQYGNCFNSSTKLHLVYGDEADDIKEFYICDKYMDLYIECEHCGRDFYGDNIRSTDYNEHLCPECYEEYLENEEYEGE